MSMQAPPSQAKRQWGVGVIWSVLAATLGWIPAALGAWAVVSIAAGWRGAGKFSETFTHSFLSIENAALPAVQYVYESIILGKNTISPAAYSFYNFTESAYGSSFIPALYTIEILLISVTLFAYGKGSSGYLHLGGLIRISEASAALKRARKLLRKNKGVRIHPHEKCRLSVQAETRHFLYVGMSGAGKSQAMQWPMLDAIERGDRLIIHDVKGEYSTMFSMEDYDSGRVVMLNPEDGRSVQHDIFADCSEKTTAPELIANTLIPSMQMNEDFWVKGAKGVLTGILTGLNAMFPGGWSWSQFSRVFEPATEGALAKLPVIIQATIAQYAPKDLVNLGGDEQQAGIIANIRADTRNLDFLGEKWPHPGGFAIRKWVRGEAHSETKILILRGIPEETYYRAALATQFSLALTTAMSLPDGDNKLWFFIDELAQLNKIDALQKSMLFLRSKGCRVVLGIQDASSLNEIYGEEAVKTIMGMCGNKIFGQASGEMAKWSSGWFSSTEKERMNATAQASQSSDALDQVMGSGLQYSTSFQREESEAVPAWCFETLPESKPPTPWEARFGAQGGPTMWVRCVGLEDYVLKLFYPYQPVIQLSPTHVKVTQPPGKPVVLEAEIIAQVQLRIKRTNQGMAAAYAKEAKRKALAAEDQRNTKGQDALEYKNTNPKVEIIANVVPVEPVNSEANEPENEASGSGEAMHVAGEQAAESMVEGLDPTGGLSIIGALCDALDAGSANNSTTESTPTIHHTSAKKKKKKALKSKGSM